MPSPDPGFVRAPFTADQVASLNGYQQSGMFHEFTCGNGACPGTQEVLVAAGDGWHCPECGYTQDWAHAMMADWSWRDRDAAFREMVRGTEESGLYELPDPPENVIPRVHYVHDGDAGGGADNRS